MSSSSSYSNHIYNNSTQQSQSGVHSSSSMNLIDLTVPAHPRIIHPRTLPSQDIEIIEIDSEDDEPQQSYIHHENDEDEDVEFLGETPAASGSGSSSSWETSRLPTSSLHESSLFQYLRGHENGLTTSTTPTPTRESEQRQQGQSWDFLTEHNEFPSVELTPLPSSRATFEERRSLSDRIRSSGIWNITPRPTSNINTREPVQRRSPLPEAEVSNTSPSYLPGFNPFRWDPIPASDIFHPYRHRRQPPAPRSSGPRWLIGDNMRIINYFQSLNSRSNSPEAQEPPEQIETQQIIQVQARIGHTKVISQDIVVACPICKNEFGHENKNTKLWVIVGCGHVICGDCIDGVFLSRVAVKSKAPKKSKTKGKAKWVAPIENEELKDQAVVDNAEISTFKLVKKGTGVCPSCSRKIKKSSIQQLYL